jgi:hypothetical protein
MNKKLKLLSLGLLAGAVISTGCGTSANLAGLGVSLDVAQKGVVAGVTFAGGSNAVTVGASYAQGTNSYAGSATIPTK